MFNLMPYRGENNLFRVFDEFEKNFWNHSIPDVRQFRTDIVDKGGSYQLSAELPGFDREDIHIDVEGGMLTISANKEDQKEDQGENYLRRERRIGGFSRSFDLSGIREDGIAATYQNGVLTLDLPKMEQQLPPGRQIPIN